MGWSRWWFQPSEKISVSWDYYSQYMETKIHVPNHQPDTNINSKRIKFRLLQRTRPWPLEAPGRSWAFRLTPGDRDIYPLENVQKAIEAMAIEIKKCGFTQLQNADFP